MGQMDVDFLRMLRAEGVEEYQQADGCRVRFFPPEPHRLDMADEPATTNAMPSREEVEAMRRAIETPEGQ